jgi:hypothetical protein
LWPKQPIRAHDALLELHPAACLEQKPCIQDYRANPSAIAKIAARHAAIVAHALY